MHLLWLSLGTDAGLTLIKLSCEAQTLDHEYYRGYGVIGQLYYSDKHHFSGGFEVGGQDGHMPACSASQNRLLNFLTPPRDFWVTFILHCLTHAVAANESLSLVAVIQHARSDRDQENAGKGVWCDSVGVCETCAPCCSYTTCLFFLFFFVVDTNWWKAADRDADFCHNAGGWLRGRTKGAKAVEDEEEEEEMTGHLPSICSPCLSSICMQLVATSSSLHIGGADELWIYTPFINLPPRGKPEQACEGMLWFSSEKGRRRPLVYRGRTAHLVPSGSVLLESVAFNNIKIQYNYVKI